MRRARLEWGCGFFLQAGPGQWGEMPASVGVAKPECFGVS
ncbi:hypothetical protein DWUX_304 [Desulfovibrio diazotrophicus]|nr:hypothetical protein DWUX_304 [Desulfovibrio diazotrophicus]